MKGEKMKQKKARIKPQPKTLSWHLARMLCVTYFCLSLNTFLARQRGLITLLLLLERLLDGVLRPLASQILVVEVGGVISRRRRMSRIRMRRTNDGGG